MANILHVSTNSFLIVFNITMSSFAVIIESWIYRSFGAAEALWFLGCFVLALIDAYDNGTQRGWPLDEKQDFACVGMAIVFFSGCYGLRL